MTTPLKLAKFFSLTLIFLTFSFSSFSQKTKKYDLLDMYKKGALLQPGESIKPLEEAGKKGVRVDTVVWLKDITFSNGTVEIDLRGKDVLQRSFLGIAFHGVNDSTYDAIYFRPFNFRSPDSIRRIHSVQYISHPQHPWYTLRENFPGQYEKAVTPVPLATDWFRAKIVVNANDIVVYVNGSSTPSLKVKKLNDRTSGKVGLWNSGLEADYANLEIMDGKK